LLTSGAASSAISSAASSTNSGATFCQEAVILGKSGTSLLRLPPAKLKADYAQFKALAPKLEAAAPSSIRSDLKAILTFDLGIFRERSKVGWTFAKIPRSVLQQWAVAGPKLKPQADKVIAYVDAKCGLKLPKP
jgi:hypothetical protein